MNWMLASDGDSREVCPTPTKWCYVCFIKILNDINMDALNL